MQIKSMLYKFCLVFFAIIFSAYTLFDSPKQHMFSSPIYKIGARGDTIKEIQEKLKNWGYYTGEVDGKFGELTSDAVKYFQAENGLVVDGIVGGNTLDALGITPVYPAFIQHPSATMVSSRESDIWLLGCLINGEGRGESYIGQVAIGAVVLNRVKHPSFPNTISGVIYQVGAFDAVMDGQINLPPSQSCLNAARDAINGWDPVGGAIYYWNPKTATNKWVQTLTVMKSVENHVFAKN